MSPRPSDVPHVEESGSRNVLENRDRHYLSAVEYGRALDTLVITCVDLVFACNHQVLLGKRRLPPRQDWWLIGGRMQTGESPLETAQRKAQIEAGLELAQDRFQFLGVYSTRFASRSQPPSPHGLHSVNLTYAVWLTADEQRHVQLCDRDYDETRWVDAKQAEQLFAASHDAIDRLLLSLLKDFWNDFA